MQLAGRTWGCGDRVVVLVHGMLGASSAYYEVGPALAGRGYRVISVDLPGHGDSPAAPDADLDLFARSVVETVGAQPELAVGHSLGAVVLAAALDELRPAKAVYVDVPFTQGGSKRTSDELRAGVLQAKARRTVEVLRRTKPAWSADDCRVEAAAAEQFDVETAVALQVVYDNDSLTGPPSTSVPSLLIRADPSNHVSDERAAELEVLGFEVRSIPGAGHSVWYGHHQEFMAVLDEFRTRV
jgi:pimeloyl-ACP methyl ester carboxylesterase